jgi:uncharacterized protein (UPF0371 family)
MKQLVDRCILLVEDEVLIGLDVRAILSEEAALLARALSEVEGRDPGWHRSVTCAPGG